MNRALIITVGIVFILLILGVWVYLMLFGTPKQGGEVFTNLGFDLGQQSTTITPPIDTQPLETLVNTQSDQALRQLTTRPVAGFAFTSASTSRTIRYVERGTGHMYEIDLDSGEESLISGTTVPQVRGAIFSPDANTVALTSYNGYTSNVFVATLGADTNLQGISLQPGATNIAFSSNTDVLYTISTSENTVGYTHNIETLARTELFSIQYNNIDVGWGSDLENIYLTTKPSKELEGFIYRTKNNILTPVTPSSYGLSAFFSKNSIITTAAKDNTYTSTAYMQDGSELILPILALKEKCTFDTFSTNLIWCASPIQNTSSTFVEDWYKGTVISEDYLWLVNTKSQTAELYANPKELSGRVIDVQEIHSNDVGDALSFINKVDNTLWLYDLSIN